MAERSLRERLALIVIADPAAAPGGDVLRVVRAALDAGAPAVQLRAKEMAARDTVALGEALRTMTAAAGALLFVNDRVDVALAVDADGAHLGDDDLPLAAARAITPLGFVLGRSVDDAEEARAAEREGADYVGVGPVFATLSKAGLGAPILAEGVAAVVLATRLPVVGIGGITGANAAGVIGAGAAGVAVIGAVMGAEDPGGEVRRLLAARG